MNKQHPAHWAIRVPGPRPGSSRSASLLLPMGAKENDMLVSTASIKAFLRIWSVDDNLKPRKAGPLAEALRHFFAQKASANRNLSHLRGISSDSAMALKGWYDSYEEACNNWGRPEEVENESIKAVETSVEAEKPVSSVGVRLRDQMAMAALQGILARHGGVFIDKLAIACEVYDYADAMIQARSSK